MKGINKILYFIIFLLVVLIGVTFYAKMNLYVIVTFNSNGGSKVESIKVKRNNKIGTLEVPTKKDYTFMYWSINNNTIDENYIVKDDVTLVAIYEKNKEEEKVIEPSLKLYTIKYNTDGGSKIGDYTVVEGEKAKKPESPVKEGYEFKEWQLNGKVYDFNSEVTSDIVLMAIYIKGEVKTYTVTFDTDGGSKIDNKVVEENTVVVKPVDPKKEGYEFKEWQLDGEAYNFSSKVTSDITLKAIYQDKINEYTITFDTDGGTEIEKQTIKENGTVTEPEPPVKEGYEFKEWQLNGKKYDFSTKVTSDIELKAVYDKKDVSDES